MKRFLTGCLVLIMLLFTGCKSSKTTGSLEQKEINSEKSCFSELLANYPGYDSFSAKISLSLATSSGTVSTKANVRMIRDKVLQISVQPFAGIEIARIRVTPDSLFAVDRINGYYVAESLADYRKSLPVDINLVSLQALFLGRPFISGQDDISIKDFRYFSFSRAGQGWSFMPVNEEGISFRFTTDSGCRLEQTEINAETGSGNVRLNWAYSLLTPSDRWWYPGKVRIDAQGLSKNIQINIGYNSPKWNSLQKIDFSVPSQYRRIKMTDLFKIFLK